MATQSEQDLENQLIKQLNTAGYERVTIPNENFLKQNLKLNLTNENTRNMLLFQKKHKEKEKL